MKKIMIFAAIAAAMTFSSCDDFLSEELRGTENIETYFQSADAISNLTNMTGGRSARFIFSKR